MSEGRETVQVRGNAIQWTDAELDRLIGIDADGNISRAVLADAKADARRFRELHAFLIALLLEGAG